jgi:hypothetical protein
MARVGKLDINSRFQIDLSLWEEQGRDFRSELNDAMCDDCRDSNQEDSGRVVDRVNPVTGEVTKLDVAWDCLIGVCATRPNFIPTNMPITRAIFRAFLAEGNRPLTPVEVHQRIGKRNNPEGILREILYKSGLEYNIVPLD